MVPGKWGLERSTDRESTEGLGWSSRIGQVDCGEENDVARLVQRIAHILQDNDDQPLQANILGGSVLPSRSHSAAEVFAYSWDQKSAECKSSISGLPQPIQRKIECEATELLYKELVRLKMEELSAAQKKLALYQNACVESGQSAYLGFSPAVGRSSKVLASSALQHGSLNTGLNKQLHAESRGTDWSAPSAKQCQTNGRNAGQRLGAPLMYPSWRYLMGLPAHRESGGTGVFLPRCRTGSRSSRTHDSKWKPGFQYPGSARHPGSVLSNKEKEMVAERTSLQYPSCSPLQEVAPDISLPSEWTY